MTNTTDLLTLYQTVFETLDDAVLITDSEGKVLLANNKAHVLLIRAKKNLAGNLMSVLFPEKLNRKHHDYKNYFNFPEIREDENEYSFIALSENGSKINISLRHRLINLTGKKLIIYILRNVSELNADLVTLKKNEEKYRSIFENIQDLYFQTDLKGIVLNVSPSVKYYSGYTPEEVIGTKVENLYNSPEDRIEFLRLLKENGSIHDFELSLKTKSGEVKQASINAHLICDDFGNPISIEGMMRDNTVRKKDSEKTHELYERYRALLNNLEIGVITHASDTSIINSNPKASELLGLSMDQMQGKLAIDPDWKFIDENKNPLPLEKYPVNQIAKSKEQIKKFIAGVNRPQTNDVVWLIVNGFPVKNEFGEILEIVISFIDITELKRLEFDISERKLMEVELIKAKEKAQESDNLKTAFLQNISHEIRTPMNAIIGFSKLLENPSLSEEIKKSHIAIINNSTNQLLSIVTDILTISALDTKQEKLNIASVNINTLIRELYEIFNEVAKGQKLGLAKLTSLNEKQANINTDKTKVTQILSNLLTNAIKFTSKGTIEFGYHLKDNFLEFYVKDEGIGISKETHEKIFERFRQADLTINEKFGGTGLGLSISKGFVELLGGKIWLSSIPEKGSTFYFTVPYHPVPDITIPKTKISKLNKQVNLLIAEDEGINFLYLKLLFEDLNFTIFHAKNGKQAIELCQTEPSINIILMDVKMPVMDGYSAALEIKKFRPDIYIIAQTGFALKSEREKYSGMAFDDFVSKPIDGNNLIQKIKLVFS